ncbi:MAG: hypothetical protein ACYS9X_03930 [Planctomycetota bacterium]
MRYSYAWEVTPDEFPQSVGRWFTEDYVKRLRHLGFAVPANWRRSMIPGWDFERERGSKYICLAGTMEGQADGHVWVTDGDGYTASAILSEGRSLLNHPDDEVRLRGRARFCMGWYGVETRPIVDTTASRFHPASVAGIVVAAMGAFVFGLYLRSYLKGRRPDSTTELTEHARAAEDRL